jgi:hypothetical protein
MTRVDDVDVDVGIIEGRLFAQTMINIKANKRIIDFEAGGVEERATNILKNK